jgi:glycosyltransferase involved in cell wall biosynthesis
MKNRIVFLTPSNIGPYHIARFSAAAARIPGLLVVPFRANERYRPWTADMASLPFDCHVSHIESTGSAHEQGEHLIADIERLSPSVVFTVGYVWQVARGVARWSKRHHVPCVVQSDSWYGDHRRIFPKEWAKRLLVDALWDAAFVSGQRAQAYIERLGILARNIWRGCDVVDNAHFACDGEWHSRDRAFLCVARLSAEKNLGRLIEAFSLYRRWGGTWGLRVAGTGPLAADLRRAVPVDVLSAVQWLGWVGYDELPAVYQAARCFVLPSLSESWGLVVNEAMGAGLPVLLSRKCGCLPELCWRGVNGFGFDPCDVHALARLMQKIESLDSGGLEAMSVASRSIISHFTPESWAQAVADCASTLIGVRRVAG